MKILIVEDDKITSRVLSRMLSSFGSCENAFDGADAYQKYVNAFEQGLPYDVIFLDISLPELDGQEVLSRIRDFEAAQGVPVTKQLPVIMVTGRDDIENILTAHVSGCVAYLTKPISREVLIQEMEQLGLGASRSKG